MEPEDQEQDEESGVLFRFYADQNSRVEGRERNNEKITTNL